MGTNYTSYCEKCKLAIDQGKDTSSIRHQLFKLYHAYRYKDHKVERYTDNQWIDKWLNNDKNKPEELYDDNLGYLVRIPDWMNEIIDEKISTWIRNEIRKYDTIEEVVQHTVELHKDRLLKENFNDFEYRLKRFFIIDEQHRELVDKAIELLPKQRIIVLTIHGEFYIDDRVSDINIFAVRNGERTWMATLRDNEILKFGTEDDPRVLPNK